MESLVEPHIRTSLKSFCIVLGLAPAWTRGPSGGSKWPQDTILLYRCPEATCPGSVKKFIGKGWSPDFSFFNPRKILKISEEGDAALANIFLTLPRELIFEPGAKSQEWKCAQGRCRS